VLPWSYLVVLGAVSLLPGFARALRAGGLAPGVRAAQALLFAVLMWREPVPALFVLLVPLLLLPLARTWWTALLALLPTIALIALGASAWQRGAARGVWLAPWEIVLLFLALALAFLGLGARAGGRVTRKTRPSRR
jgi:hypothetical protein